MLKIYVTAYYLQVEEFGTDVAKRPKKKKKILIQLSGEFRGKFSTSVPLVYETIFFCWGTVLCIVGY